MRHSLNIAGVPRGLALDGWWLSESAEPEVPSGGGGRFEGWRASPWQSRGLGLAVLVLLADLLFWGQALGLSLALFSGAVFLVAVVDRAPIGRVLRGALVMVLCALPVVEYLQALSVLFLVFGTLGAIVVARGQAAIADMLRLAGRLPWAGVAALGASILRVVERTEEVDSASFAPGLKAALRNWAFPLGGTLVFLALLVDANPVLEGLFYLEVDVAELLNRGLFWGGVALVLWPLLERREVVVDPERKPWAISGAGIGINAASVLRALVMFNLLIGVQTGLDLSIFAGGADLPEGMTHATYAHRGAYPLLITAVLAGAFSLAARPHLASHPAMKPLLLLWLAQNIALTASAALRLDLYIDVYGLTYLRVHALNWMGLVAAGLGLAIWQVARERSNMWVLRRTGAMSLATLYVCCFVNFAGVIAAHNIESSAEFDLYYACDLGPTATAALSRRAGAVADETGVEIGEGVFVAAPHIEGWRDWGFRNWRVGRYLEAVAQTEPSP